MRRTWIIFLILFTAVFAGAAKNDSAPAPTTPPVRPAMEQKEWSRLEGEQRFRTNCGRCHQAPHKFAPRMMGTIVRHMRVRAMLTEDDMKLILEYMTE
jgi:mono/diheme cytochrome c family protein